MPTVVALADLHGNLPSRLPEGDVLLIAGDVCPIEDHGVDYQRRWLEESFYPWLEGLPHPEIAWIAGNHDFICQLPDWQPDGRAIYLRDSGARIGGLAVWGTPWIPHLKRWAFYADQEALAARTEAIPEVDVVISHGPPHGTGDRTIWGVEVGSEPLRDRLAELEPALCIFGHIHEAYGRWQRRATTLANVSYVDERYRVREGAPMSFELARADTSG